MVNDARVMTLLGRLGGLYRDPARVNRDASSLLKSSVGIHLTPGIAPLVENNGDSSHCLVLQGTIAIVFRGNTYQLLVDIYLPPGYPIRPPVSFVRLAENMYLKEHHPHVGSDGMVYLPYTHEWNPRTHSLIEMVVAMSSVFSADPPVFTRAPAPQPPPPPSYSSYTSSSNSNSSPMNRKPAAPNSSIDSERYIQDQIAAIMAKEAEEARTAETEQKLMQQQIAAQREWEEKKLKQIRTEVNQKIQSYLMDFTEETKKTLSADWRDQEHLKHNKDQIQKEMQELTEKKKELKDHIEIIDEKTKEINEWLEESKNAVDGEPEVDDVCQPVNKLDAQMLDLSAENAALTDAMYFLDRGMYMGQIDCTTHLKMIRKLAKRQFLVRAHLIKINRVITYNQK
mmetsp:Transcript_15345/g.42571  ORF Transcript_15345/g.42571 Transcript_15345/m.42571 type:complete len:397 (-) Transcript_15345:1106-2296(-)